MTEAHIVQVDLTEQINYIIFTDKEAYSKSARVIKGIWIIS